jgi:predicted transcriptional regulator
MNKGLAIDKILQITRSKNRFWYEYYSNPAIKKKLRKLVEMGFIKEEFRNDHGVYYVPVKENKQPWNTGTKRANSADAKDARELLPSQK